MRSDVTSVSRREVNTMKGHLQKLVVLLAAVLCGALATSSTRASGAERVVQVAPEGAAIRGFQAVVLGDEVVL